MPAKQIVVVCMVSFLCLFIPARSLPQETAAIPAGAKVFVEPMDGFETYLKAAIAKKKVPLQIVEDKAKAEFVMTGHSESEKASTAKKVILGNWHSNEDASINISNSKTGEVVFAYEAHKERSAHGQQSTAEACAKHLKEKIAGK